MDQAIISLETTVCDAHRFNFENDRICMFTSVVSMTIALFIDDATGAYGQTTGKALNKVCKLAMPFGTYKNNVFHNNAEWGFYMSEYYPAKVLTDENGYVADWNSCMLWNMKTGEDNSNTIVIENHIEYFDEFVLGCMCKFIFFLLISHYLIYAHFSLSANRYRDKKFVFCGEW